MDELLLKAELLVEGTRVAAGALDGVGERFKEQVHHLFEYDFDLHQRRAAPSELRLPGGSIVQVRLNERSPFTIDRGEDGRLVVSHGEAPRSSAEWIERPTFYSLTTASGQPMTRIAELVGEDCLSVCHTNACLTFANGKQCAFCNLNFTPKQYDEVLVKKRADEVAEVMATALRDGTARHFLITGGILPGDREMLILEAYLAAIRSATGLDRLPGVAIMTPPADLQRLERLHELGLEGIGFNLECFDPAFFRAFCPGKEELVGYDRYREALRAAVAIFGAGGRVFSGMIAGLEPKERLLDGVQELAEEGVATIPLVWSPSAGTRLHGHRPPRAEWYVELTERVVGLTIRHLKRAKGAPPPEPLRCRRCQMQCLYHDVIHHRLDSLRAVTGIVHAA